MIGDPILPDAAPELASAHLIAPAVSVGVVGERRDEATPTLLRHGQDFFVFEVLNEVRGVGGRYDLQVGSPVEQCMQVRNELSLCLRMKTTIDVVEHDGGRRARLATNHREQPEHQNRALAGMLRHDALPSLHRVED